MAKSKFTLNGSPVEVSFPDGATLLDVLRRSLRLTGSKEGCSMGECGACTVLVDDEPVTSCIMLAAQADGRSIRTIEGLAEGDKLHPVQDGFLQAGGVQCGFCTPGMVMACAALLERSQSPTTGQIHAAIAGNLCRCTGYAKILQAVQVAAQIMRERRAQSRMAARA